MCIRLKGLGLVKNTSPQFRQLCQCPVWFVNKSSSSLGINVVWNNTTKRSDNLFCERAPATVFFTPGMCVTNIWHWCSAVMNAKPLAKSIMAGYI